MDRPEQIRRASAKQRVLALLQERGRVTNLELGQVCQRYGARIWEAKREGHDITEPVCLAPGIYEYEYRGLVKPGQVNLPLHAA